MKIPPNLLAAAAVTAVSLAALNSRAASIGANWVNNNSGGLQNSATDSLSPTESAGAPPYAQTNWNNLGRWGNPTTLNDSLGNSSGVDVTWDANWTVNLGTATTNGNLKLMYGFTEATGAANDDGPPYNGFTGANQPDARFRGLSAWLAARGSSTYSVLLYVDGNLSNGSVSEHWLQGIETDGDFGGGIALGADITPRIFVSDSANFSGTFTQVPLSATTQGTAAAGNYILFSGLSADMFILRSEDTYATYAPVSGIQIVPEYTKPHIDVQPQTPAQAIYSGESFSLSVIAAGPGPLSYQWRKNDSPINNATNGVFTASNVAAGDSGSYDVIVGNSFGSVTSSVVAITVNSDAPAANAVVTPASVNRGVGGSITFSVTASGTMPFTYQWRKGAAPLVGQNSATLTLNNLAIGDAGSYTCAVSNTLGGTISSAGVLSVHAVAGTTLGVNFKDSSGADVSADALGVPLANWVNSSGDATGSTTASGLNISWSSKNTWRQGTPEPGAAEVFYGYLDDGTDANNPLGASVVISGLDAVFGGYVVRVASATDNGSSLLDVTITNGPVTVSFPSPASVGGAKYGLSTVSPALYAPAIKLQGTAGENGGPRGGIAGFIITDKPVIASQPVAPEQTVYVGETLVLAGADAFGVPPLSYQWRKNGANISGATSLNFTNSAPTGTDSGNYTLVVSNQYGSTTSSVVAVTISSSAPINLAVTPETAAYSVGGTVVFQLTAEGNLPMTYQWYKGATKLNGQTSSALTLSNLQVSDAGSYTVAVTNSLGGDISPVATLTVGTVAPATLGINFTIGDEPVTAAALGVASENWFAVPGPVNPGMTIGSVTVACSADGMWQQGQLTPPGDNEVFYGYLDDGNPGASVSLSGLAATFPAYVVQVLGATDNGSGLLNVTINGSETLTYPSPQVTPDEGLIGKSTQSSALYADTLTIQGMPGLSGQGRGGIAGLIITDKPVLQDQPQAPTNTIYTEGSFSLSGLNVIGVPPLAYQWRKNGTPIPGATSAVYTKSNVVSGDAGNYDVVVTNSFGSVTSVAVSVTGIVANPKVTVTRSGTDMVLSWPSGSLLEATNVLGPWTTNSATSPYQFTPTAPQRYFRLQLQ